MPVFGTMAARFNDDGVTALFQSIAPALVAKGLKLGKAKLPIVSVKASSRGRAIVPAEASATLAEIADAVRGYHKHTAEQARVARERQALRISKKLFEGCKQGCRLLRRADRMEGRRTDRLFQKAPRHVAEDRRALRGRRVRREDPRQGNPHRPHLRVAVRQQDPQGCPADLRGRRRDPALPDEGKRPRLLPLHRRRVRLQARR
jgi:hypothetical protein